MNTKADRDDYVARKLELMLAIMDNLERSPIDPETMRDFTNFAGEFFIHSDVEYWASLGAVEKDIQRAIVGCALFVGYCMGIHDGTKGMMG